MKKTYELKITGSEAWAILAGLNHREEHLWKMSANESGEVVLKYLEKQIRIAEKLQRRIEKILEEKSI